MRMRNLRSRRHVMTASAVPPFGVFEKHGPNGDYVAHDSEYEYSVSSNRFSDEWNAAVYDEMTGECVYETWDFNSTPQDAWHEMSVGFTGSKTADFDYNTEHDEIIALEDDVIDICSELRSRTGTTVGLAESDDGMHICFCDRPIEDYDVDELGVLRETLSRVLRRVEDFYKTSSTSELGVFRKNSRSLITLDAGKIDKTADSDYSAEHGDWYIYFDTKPGSGGELRISLNNDVIHFYKNYDDIEVPPDFGVGWGDSITFDPTEFGYNDPSILEFADGWEILDLVDTILTERRYKVSRKRRLAFKSIEEVAHGWSDTGDTEVVFRRYIDQDDFEMYDWVVLSRGVNGDLDFAGAHAESQQMLFSLEDAIYDFEWSPWADFFGGDIVKVSGCNKRQRFENAKRLAQQAVKIPSFSKFFKSTMTRGYYASDDSYNYAIEYDDYYGGYQGEIRDINTDELIYATYDVFPNAKDAWRAMKDGRMEKNANAFDSIKMRYVYAGDEIGDFTSYVIVVGTTDKTEAADAIERYLVDNADFLYVDMSYGEPISYYDWQMEYPHSNYEVITLDAEKIGKTASATDYVTVNDLTDHDAYDTEEYWNGISPQGHEIALGIDYKYSPDAIGVFIDGMNYDEIGIFGDFDEAFTKAVERLSVYVFELENNVKFPRDYWGRPILGAKARGDYPDDELNELALDFSGIVSLSEAMGIEFDILQNRDGSSLTTIRGDKLSFMTVSEATILEGELLALWMVLERRRNGGN